MQQGPSTADRFPTTSWTRIRRSLASREEMEGLLTAYWGPVYAYIRRSGNDRETAADLTQGFITAKLLDKDKLLTDADSSRGRFRTYLLTAVKRYLIDMDRAENGRRSPHEDDERETTARSRPRTVQIDADALASVEPLESDDPPRAFRRQWATTALNLALERVEADCRQRRLEPHWAIYEARILHPACSGCTPVAVEDLAAQHGVSAAEIYSMLNTVKRKFRNTLESVVLDTIDDHDDLAGEMSELRGVLAMPID